MSAGTHPRVPDFFVVGHPKCGTSAMYEMLKQHPQIFMPAIKELRFFARDIVAGAAAPAISQTLDEHLSIFADAPPGARVGEMSVVCLWSRTAASAIAEVAPAARIVAILREPTGFVRSLHLQRLRQGGESEHSLRRAIALEPERRAGRQLPPGNVLPQALQYTERVRYVEQLRRYHAHFPEEQVLVLIYDDFRADNVATMREVLRFLGVDDSHEISPVEANPTVAAGEAGAREGKGWRRARRPPVRGALARAREALALKDSATALAARRRSRVRFTEAPPVDEELMRELRERFRPEVQALSEYLGRDLVRLWGYDRAG